MCDNNETKKKKKYRVGNTHTNFAASLNCV